LSTDYSIRGVPSVLGVGGKWLVEGADLGSETGTSLCEGVPGENLRKHRVSFDEAKSAFLDDNARVIADPEQPDDEDRFVLLGLSVQLRLLVVVHCYREAENVIRIISARKADPSERRQYSEFVS
jgi:uncharacterized DUF497 family protein